MPKARLPFLAFDAGGFVAKTGFSVARTVTGGLDSAQPKKDVILLKIPGFSVWAIAARDFVVFVAPGFGNQFGICICDEIGDVHLGFV